MRNTLFYFSLLLLRVLVALLLVSCGSLSASSAVVGTNAKAIDIRDYYGLDSIDLGGSSDESPGTTGATTTTTASVVRQQQQRQQHRRGRGVRVVLIDTGLDEHYVSVSGNCVRCVSVVPNVACSARGFEHGTHSASVLAGNLWVNTSSVRSGGGGGGSDASSSSSSSSSISFVGMAPEAEVLMIRAFDTNGRTSPQFLLAALNETLRAHPHVLSLSYGAVDYYSTPAISLLLARLAVEESVTIVVASGNEGPLFGGVLSPADQPWVLSVGSVRAERKKKVGKGRGGGGYHRFVSSFSGRGPTTWELPFGSGRVKPDLVALGENVLAVDGIRRQKVRQVKNRGNKERYGYAHQHEPGNLVKNCEGSFLLNASEGHDVKLKCEERKEEEEEPAAVASSPSPEAMKTQLRRLSVSGTSVAAPIVAGAVALCVEALLRNEVPRSAIHAGLIKSILFRTATVLTPPPVPRTRSNAKRAGHHQWQGSHPTTPLMRRTLPASVSSDVYSGVPLLRTYQRYVDTLRYSIYAQGAGELQPRGALQWIEAYNWSSLYSSSFMERHEFTFLPPRLVVGNTAADDGGEEEGKEACLYLWPYCEQPLFPGATPLVFNVTVHTFNGGVDRKDDNTAACFNRYKVHVEAVTAVAEERQEEEGHSGASHFPWRRRWWRSRQNENVREVTVNISSDDVARRLLEVRVMAVPSTVTTSMSVGFSSTLSVVLSCPESYYATTKEEAMGAGERHLFLDHLLSSLSPSFRELRVRGYICAMCDASNETLDDISSSFPFSKLERQQQRLHRCQIHNALPFSVSLIRPPPRAQRVLLDTSLQWLNPVEASRAFVPGDNPRDTIDEIGNHNHAEGAQQHHARVRTRSQQLREGSVGGGDVAHAHYGEVYGDHPHTNLAPLFIYMRHELGLYVEYFPVFSRSSASLIASPAMDRGGTGATNHRARGLRSLLLSRVGTLLLLDPELPLLRQGRRALTHAVRDEGLHVVLVTDWYSEGLARHISASSGYRLKHAPSVSSRRDGDAVTSGGSGGGASEEEVFGSGDDNRYHLISPEDSHKKFPSASHEELNGTCHVPSINQWLREVTADLPDSLQLSEQEVWDGPLMIRAGTRGWRSVGTLNSAGRVYLQSRKVARRGGGEGHINVSVRVCNVHPEWSAKQSELFRGQASSTSEALSHNSGIIGFIFPSPHLHTVAADGDDDVSTSGPSSPLSWRGRIALLSDSNCLSLPRKIMQVLLFTLAGTEEGDLGDSEVTRLMKQEGTSSSVCFELIKELLAAVLSGDPSWFTERQSGFVCHSNREGNHLHHHQKQQYTQRPSSQNRGEDDHQVEAEDTVERAERVESEFLRHYETIVSGTHREAISETVMALLADVALPEHAWSAAITQREDISQGLVVHYHADWLRREVLVKSQSSAITFIGILTVGFVAMAAVVVKTCAKIEERHFKVD